MGRSSDIYLKIASPEASVLGRMVSKVSLPGMSGRFTVLPGHAPLISALSEGDIEYFSGDGSSSVHIKSGFVEVREDVVSVCVQVK